METGTGKTPVAIELIKHRKVKTLVVCPLSIIESVWMAELKKWHPEARIVNLWKEPCYPYDFDVGMINYESVRKFDREYLRSIGFLILDESSKIKNPDAMVTKFFAGRPSGAGVGGIADFINYRLLLSGTPAPNSMLEYWSQMRIVHSGLLGDNYYAYRAVNFYSYGYGNYNWEVRKERKQWIIDRIKQRAFYISKKDCLDLPEQIFQVKKYYMDGKQRAAYDRMKKQNVIPLINTEAIGVNELAKVMKLRQITSGFVVDERKNAVHVSDGKMKLLKETLEEIGKDQAIIWCQFHYEIEKITDMLIADGKTVGCLYGDMNQQNKERSIENFKNGAQQYLIAHPKSGGFGLSFTDCGYNIYYSLDYSFEGEKQSQDRTHRIGQEKKVVYIYLIADKSVDENIYRALRKKQKMSDFVLEFIKNERDTFDTEI